MVEGNLWEKNRCSLNVLKEFLLGHNDDIGLWGYDMMDNQIYIYIYLSIYIYIYIQIQKINAKWMETALNMYRMEVWLIQIEIWWGHIWTVWGIFYRGLSISETGRTEHGAVIWYHTNIKHTGIEYQWSAEDRKPKKGWTDLPNCGFITAISTI